MVGVDGRDVPASELLAREVQRAAVARIASLGPHLITMLMKSTSDVSVPPNANVGEEQAISERARSQAPLTPLADDEAASHLGSWGKRPSSVGDLIEARGTDGSRVSRELRTMCALEAARMTPKLAAGLAAAHPDLATELAREHAAAGTDDGPVDDALAAVAAAVAALLSIELLTVVEEQMGDMPLASAVTDH